MRRAENRLLLTTPDAWEEAMCPAVGNVRVREVLGRRFSAEVQIFSLPRTAFFSLRMLSSRIALPEGSGFVSANLLTRGRIRTTAPIRGSEWLPGTAHVVNHEEHAFDFTGSEHLDVLTLCFQKPLLQEYANKFIGPDSEIISDLDQVINVNSTPGACFTRYMSFVWDELNRGGAFLQSTIATREMENSLWAMFLSACDIGTPGQYVADHRFAGYVKQAEEYMTAHLASPLCVADLAAAVGVSASTLSRAFRKLHGTGPKAFLKQRRLDRVRSELLSADQETCTVTKTAMTYGFCHLSQFAADYKRAFHESPSETLRRG